MRIESSVDLEDCKVRIKVRELTREDLQIAVAELKRRSAALLRRPERTPIDECWRWMIFYSDAESGQVYVPSGGRGWFLIIATWIGLSLLDDGEDREDLIRAFSAGAGVDSTKSMVSVVRDDKAGRATVEISIDESAWPAA